MVHVHRSFPGFYSIQRLTWLEFGVPKTGWMFRAEGTKSSDGPLPTHANVRSAVVYRLGWGVSFSDLLADGIVAHLQRQDGLGYLKGEGRGNELEKVFKEHIESAGLDAQACSIPIQPFYDAGLKMATIELSGDYRQQRAALGRSIAEEFPTLRPQPLQLSAGDAMVAERRTTS